MYEDRMPRSDYPDGGTLLLSHQEDAPGRRAATVSRTTGRRILAARPAVFRTPHNLASGKTPALETHTSRDTPHHTRAQSRSVPHDGVARFHSRKDDASARPRA